MRRNNAGRGATLLILAGWMLAAATAMASGPRWVTGSPYFTAPANGFVIWNTTNLRYYTDPGDLSAAVNHAAADAMVATAAGVWNTNIASITLSQGGALNEHVSGANVYLGSNGPVFPSDVSVGNAAAVPVAVIYDTDGSVTDTLLGGGASDPGNCRQSAVTESVDGITRAGQITHALIVLNGRCTGAAPELQQEMTYRLIRVFGRVLGLSWSQTNDNVFTGGATYLQAQYWPLMHPMDILCGPYAYQCLPSPFTLRPDDIASLVRLYTEYGHDAGKIYTYTSAAAIGGVVYFPSGQPMAGVNVVARRQNPSTALMEGFEIGSGVSGFLFQQDGGNPAAAKSTSMAASMGGTTTSLEGYFEMTYLPILSGFPWENIQVTTQPLNPLYTGQYAVGPYPTAQVTPSGSSLTAWARGIGAHGGATVPMTISDATAVCTASGDGTAAAPVNVAASGMWSGAMCGYGHTAWSALPVKAGRTLTVELSAVDEHGFATTGKMQPVIGVWATSDATNVAPTVAAAVTPLNTTVLGMTAVGVTNASARTLRIGLGDQRGDGRPDFAYNARVLYADSVAPASLPANGGQVTIAGMGFRRGNAVTVNGVQAQVLSWTPTTIVAIAPPLSGAQTVDVVVTDLSTGGRTAMAGALAYSGVTLPDGLTVVSVPADGSALGGPAAVPFAVRVMLPDGVAPAAGMGVMVTAGNGAALGGCGGASACVLTTDATGLVQTAVSPVAQGTVTLTAIVGAASVSASFVAGAAAADVLRVVSMPGGTVYTGVAAAAPFAVQAFSSDGVTPRPGAQVTLSAVGAGLGACGGAAGCGVTADASGMVSTSVTPAAVGLVSLTASEGGGMVSASFGAVALPASTLRVVSAPADGAYAGVASSTVFQVQVLLGDGVTPAVGVTVTLSASGAQLGVCGGVTCVVRTDASGMASTTVTPSAAGPVMLTATLNGVPTRLWFQAAPLPPDQMRVVSLPASGGFAGSVAPGSFKVQLVAGDGVTALVGKNVTLTSVGGTMGVCGAATCVVATDANGMVATVVTASAAGWVGLAAAGDGLSLSTSFLAVADTLRVVSVPAGPSFVGVPTRTPLVLQVLGPDGVTPAAGAVVTLSATLATLAGCVTPTCVMIADANGMVSVVVYPVVAGVVSISATAGGSIGTSFATQWMGADGVRFVSVPTGQAYVGVVAATPVIIKVLLGDAYTPAAGASVRIWTTNGSVSGGCGTACYMTADASGTVTTSVMPLAVGTVTMALLANGGQAGAVFQAVALPADVLTVVSAPADGSFVGRVAGTQFAVKALLGDGRTPAASATVTLTAVGATLGICGGSTCTTRLDGTGSIATTVTPGAAGTVTLTAAAGGGTVSTTFLAAAPPDVLTVVSTPANGSFVGSAAAARFAVKVKLADGVTAAAGVSVTLTASNGTLGACGLASCVVTADGTGSASSTVTPASVGTVSLTASAGGGTASASFTAAAVPADSVRVVSAPANGAYVGRAAAVPFAVKVTLPDGVTAAAGVAVTLTASNGTLGACGLASCVVTADTSGSATSSVTPVAAGTVGLMASAGGGTASASFSAGVAPDGLSVVSAPANGAFVGIAAGTPLKVKVMQGDGVTAAAGVSVTVTATGGTLGACGVPVCVLTADGSGMVTTAVTPTAAGTVGLTAAAGGGTVSASFTAVAMPVDVLSVISAPANGAFVGVAAAVPFRVKVLLGDGVTLAAGASVTVTVSAGTLGVCGAASCVLTADAAGTVSTSVTPTAVGTVGLSASAGGGSVSASFTAVAAPADGLTVTSVPASGAYAGTAAALPFQVKVVKWDGTAAAGVAVTISAGNAMLGACGLGTCVITADATGSVSTPVTPSAAGAVALIASAGGGSVSASFTAVAVPLDGLSVVSSPGNGSYVGIAASAPFRVKVVLGDGTTAAAGVPVTMTASNGTLGACGLTACVVTTDATGLVSTTVTPTAAGTVGLTAAAGGGSVSASFVAVAVPADVLTVLSVPANGSFAGRVAATPFQVKVVAWDGTAAAGVAVTVSATNGTLGACGSASCVLTADPTGTVATTVTPVAAGTVVLTAAAGGGSVSATFSAVAVPADVLTVTSVPANGTYVGSAGAAPFRVKVALGDGSGPAAAVAVTVSAVNGTLGACGLGTCVLTADATGAVATTVTPIAAGTVGLTAVAGGGTVSASFMAVAVPPDQLAVVSAPADGTFVGSIATAPLRVKVLLGDGVTAGNGVAVTVTATGATLGACGAPSCVLTADSAGMVATTVTPVVAGTVGLRASAGGGVATALFVAVNHVRTVTVAQAMEYVAPGAVVPWTPRVVVVQDGSPAAALVVSWSSATGMVVAASSTTDGSGSASVGATIGPMAAGATAPGTACAWTTVCASFGAVVVDAPAWRIAAGSGLGQSVAAGVAFAPVVARVVDTAGHGVAGVAVDARQVVRGWVACPATGRCPVGPVLGQGSMAVVSDVDGFVAVTPQTVDGVAETTQIVLVAGPQGYLAGSVSRTP